MGGFKDTEFIMIKNIVLTTVAISLLVSLVAYLALKAPQAPESQAFINATVLTMDAGNTQAEAVLLEGDRIKAVGSTADILALTNDHTQIHDLAGKTLLPGFIDAHGHFPGSGLEVSSVNLGSPPIGKVNSIPQLLEQVRLYAANSQGDGWVLGMGYDDTLLAEQRHPTRDELDAAVPDKPVMITHASGHLAVVNSLALQQAGINEQSVAPEGGAYGRDSEGRLNGLMEETAVSKLQVHAVDISFSMFLEMVRYASNEYAEKGVTTAQNGGAPKFLGQALALASRLGQVPFRLEIWPLFDEWGEELLEDPDSLRWYEHERLNIGAIKIIADGSIQGYTGYLSQPYHQPFHGDEDYQGYPRIPRDKLFAWVEKFHRAGFQMAIHGNGDGAIDDIVAAFEAAQVQSPVADPRLILIHAQMAREDQLQAMKSVGITPSFFSAHTYYWGDRHRRLFMGPERAANMSPAASAAALDLPFTIHLDTPVVPMDPLFSVWTAVNRQTRSGFVVGEQQRISVLQALRANTIDAAWQIFRDKDLGSIESGKLADLVVLGSNPLDAPKGLKDIQVEQTIVGGVSIFKAPR